MLYTCYSEKDDCSSFICYIFTYKYANYGIPNILIYVQLK